MWQNCVLNGSGRANEQNGGARLAPLGPRSPEPSFFCLMTSVRVIYFSWVLQEQQTRSGDETHVPEGPEQRPRAGTTVFLASGSLGLRAAAARTHGARCPARARAGLFRRLRRLGRSSWGRRGNGGASSAHPLFTGEEMSWLVLGHSEAKELGTQDQWLGLPFSPRASQSHFAHTQPVHSCLGSG